MPAEEEFLRIASLICEPARAKILWTLLDGRAYTATELSFAADISPTSASNHLNKLLDARILQVQSQGRHRYFTFSRPEVAYAVESLGSLAESGVERRKEKKEKAEGIRFCRTCYDHLAGTIGVQITEALQQKGIIKPSGPGYLVTTSGWKWLLPLGISEDAFTGSRRPVAKQCLDWSERRPHLAGQLGAALLHSLSARKWFRNLPFSRELALTPRGIKEMSELLGLRVQAIR